MLSLKNWEPSHTCDADNSLLGSGDGSSTVRLVSQLRPLTGQQLVHRAGAWGGGSPFGTGTPEDSGSHWSLFHENLEMLALTPAKELAAAAAQMNRDTGGEAKQAEARCSSFWNSPFVGAATHTKRCYPTAIRVIGTVLWARLLSGGSHWWRVHIKPTVITPTIAVTRQAEVLNAVAFSEAVRAIP